MEKEWIGIPAERWLEKQPNLYAIDSEVIPKLHYAADKDDFLLVRGHDIYRMSLHEAEEVTRAINKAMQNLIEYVEESKVDPFAIPEWLTTRVKPEEIGDYVGL